MSHNHNHPLIAELSKLKESAREAVANADITNQDQLKKHLHLARQVEMALKRIIQKAANNTSPVLLLVCGNVGDGKSHLLAELRADPTYEQLLAQFKIHNDATESFSPEETSNETLEKLLSPFSDNHLGTVPEKLILAINLGTLSNFLSVKREGFDKLKSFVEAHGIIELGVRQGDDAYIEESIFQFINFTSYHFYELTASGAQASVIEKLLFKVIEAVPSNPLYRAYQVVRSQSWAVNCPVVANFEFLSLDEHRKVIAGLLVESMLKHKLIVSFRQLLNFIYDLLVPYTLANVAFDNYPAEVSRLSPAAKLRCYTPYYLFEHAGVSMVFTSMNLLDPAIRRYEELDDVIIALFTASEPAEVFKDKLPGLPLPVLKYIEQAGTEQSLLNKLLLRFYYFRNSADPRYQDDHFQEFIQSLFAYNTGNGEGLKPIIETVKSAAFAWNGGTSVKNKAILPSMSKRSQYRLFRHVVFKAVIPPASDRIHKDTLYQFLPEVRIPFTVPGLPNQEVSIDYSLFVLLKKITQGYRPNKLDRNNYVNYVRFVERVIFADIEGQPILIDEINYGKPVDFKLELDDYDKFVFTKL